MWSSTPVVTSSEAELTPPVDESIDQWAFRRSLFLGAVAVPVYLAVFHFRFDHAAHLLAGFGVCLVALPFAWRRGVSGSPAVMTAILATIGAALVVEVVQPGAVVDTADVANTAVGAVLAGTPWLNGRGSEKVWRPMVFVGVSAIAIAFVVRYPLWLAVEGIR
jgi:hypothetical protein